MRQAMIIACALTILTGCAVMPDNRKASPLRHVKLAVGTTRLDAERIIADATGVKSKYDLYAMDTSLEVRYQDGSTVLLVHYKPGSPAPWVTTPDGHAQHLPPIDGEVLSWEFLTQAAEGIR
ncbi:MAG: hypothetical protein WC701_13945 [Kiritimatiellales bacterium]|jgi:hypothetical protein